MLRSTCLFHKTKPQRLLWTVFAAFSACAFLIPPDELLGEQVSVRHVEGVTHGFLVLRTPGGPPIAYGELQQIVKSGRVTDTLTFRFKDTSFYQETTIFSQRGHFRLLSDRVVQRGPSFKEQTDTSIDAATHNITVRTMEKGKQKTTTKHLDLPPDVYNGLILTIVKNIEPTVPQTTISFVAASSTPRVVKLDISPLGEDKFSNGTINESARHFVLKVEIPGPAGVIAPVLGKQPPDIHVWVIKGEAPVFVQFDGPLYQDGPVWRMELAKPRPSK